MLAKLWGGEPQEGRSHRVSLPPHFRDDKAPSAPSQGTHCPIVHLAPEGMQPKVRRVLHQSAKPWDQVLAGSSEGIRRVPGRTENGGASPTYTRGARERSALQEASVFRLRGAPRGSQDTAELTMLLSLTLLLLMGLSTCAVAGDEELTLSAEAGSWEGVIPSIQLQLQEVKRGKARQFFGLMGKRVGGVPPIQPERRTGNQRGQVVPDLLGKGRPSTEADQPARPTLFSVFPVRPTWPSELTGVPSRTLSLKQRLCINILFSQSQTGVISPSALRARL
ncbi:tachykinin-4 isoform X2 [Equus przewalskii]|uniref:Tachykinin-4 isoform X2 n=1 Tax=Equus przewalskii TaxID=9798 RepID=A0ABM4JLD3_EQUPR